MTRAQVESPRAAWIVLASRIAVLAAGSILALTPGCRPPNGPGVAQTADRAVDLNDAKRRAQAGEPEGQYLLGRAYARGQGVAEDYREAARWYELAARQDHAAAQTALGELYEAGQGVTQDDSAAAEWYRRAATRDFPSAQYNLGVLYVTGKGVDRDVQEAIRWFRLAAEHGDPLAQHNLGMRYNEGNGLPADPVESWKWLTLASNRGVEAAGTARDSLQRRMTRAQVGEARRRTEAFTPKPAARSATAPP